MVLHHDVNFVILGVLGASFSALNVPRATPNIEMVFHCLLLLGIKLKRLEVHVRAKRKDQRAEKGEGPEG